MRAGVFVFHLPFSELIRYRQLSIRDQSQVGLFLAWSELNYFVYRTLSSRDAFLSDIIIEQHKTSLLFLLPMQTRQTYRLRAVSLFSNCSQSTMDKQ